MFRFRIFGIPVEVQPMFWIVFFVFGGALRGENWNAHGMLHIALFIMAGFLSLMVHELGHALTGKAFGAPTQITLHGFGGYAAFPAGSFTRKQNFVVTFAGPAVQILLGVIMLLLVLFAHMPSPAIKFFVGTLAGISLYWAVLNLLPVVPLDGGNMLMSVLGPTRIRATLWISFVTAITAGCAMLIYTHSILFPLFLASFAYENWKVIQHLKGR